MAWSVSIVLLPVQANSWHPQAGSEDTGFISVQDDVVDIGEG